VEGDKSRLRPGEGGRATLAGVGTSLCLSGVKGDEGDYRRRRKSEGLTHRADAAGRGASTASSLNSLMPSASLASASIRCRMRIRELAGLGLLDRLDEVAVRTGELVLFDSPRPAGLATKKRGLDAGHDVPQFSIHRGRLQGVIHQAVIERLGSDAIHTGCRLGSFTQG